MVVPPVPPLSTPAEVAFLPSKSLLDDNDPSTLIALRYDKTHVLFRLGDSGDFSLTNPEQEKMLHDLPEAIAEYGRAPTSEPDPQVWESVRTSFDQAHVGELWQLEVTAGSRILVVVQKPIELVWNCSPSSYTAGFIAEVVPEAQAAFAALPENYFLVHKSTAVPNPEPSLAQTKIGLLRDWKPTSETRTQMEQAISAKVKGKLAAAHAKPWVYEGRTDIDESTKAEYQGWKLFEEKAASGEGKLTYDVHASEIAPDGRILLFVRARWMVDHERAYLVSFWLRVGGTAVTEITDPRGTRDMWMTKGFYREEDMNLDQLGAVLNVFDRQDGYGDVLLYMPGYEGYDIHLFRYTDAGLVATTISHGDGC
jgi:hypothetical protein